MSTHRATLLAWGLAALAVTLLVSGFVAYLAADAFEFTGVDLLGTAITLSFSVVGALIARRQPDNAIGWIFLGVAVFTGLGGLAHGYVEYRFEGERKGRRCPRSGGHLRGGELDSVRPRASQLPHSSVS